MPEHLLAEAQLPNPNFDIVLVEQTHDHRLAMIGRNDAHPQVEFFLSNSHLDPTVLRPPTLGNVNFPQNFDP